MNFGGLPLPLRCLECNKPFDKPSTLRRHGYYCRSKNSLPKPERTRSCVVCVKTKQRCDQRRPGCSRCAFKNLKCSYSGPASRSGLSTQSSRESEILLDVEITLDKSFTPVSSSGITPLLETITQQDNALGNTDQLNPSRRSGATELESLDSASFQTDPIFLEMFGDQPTKNSMPDLSLTPLTPASLDIPREPSNLVRQITRRSDYTITSQRVANLILSTLRSYPLMLINHNKAPPFIHHSALNTGVSEPMTNCLSFMQMLRVESVSASKPMSSAVMRPNTKLFWRNVGWECERLCSDIASFSQDELLAALQALLVYLLIRLSEGETEHNNYDHLLVKTVIVLSLQFTTVYSNSYNASVELSQERNSDSRAVSSKQSWDNFIIMESLRRICLIYQIVNLIVHFAPAAMCQLPSNIVVAPLPSRKEPWASKFEHEFEAEMRTASTDDKNEILTYGMTAGGGLVKLKSYIRGDPSDMYGGFVDSNKIHMQEAAWEEYCEGMDELGGLVLLSSSLLR